MIQTDIITAHEAAAYLKVHYSTIMRLLHERKIPGFRVGADWRLSRASLDRWMREAEVKREQT